LKSRGATRISWKKASHILSERVIRKGKLSSIKNRSNLTYAVFAYTDNPNMNMIDQLGRCYDFRYMQGYKRVKFLASLSNYNDDEIVEKIERGVIENTKERRKELEEYNIEKRFVTENISRLILEWYPDLDIRELAVCYMIICTEWDVDAPFYFELVSRIVCEFMKLFFGLNHIQDTIQDLIHKGDYNPKTRF
jgi:hypothetical protein